MKLKSILIGLALSVSLPVMAQDYPIAVSPVSVVAKSEGVKPFDVKLAYKIADGIYYAESSKSCDINIKPELFADCLSGLVERDAYIVVGSISGYSLNAVSATLLDLKATNTDQYSAEQLAKYFADYAKENGTD